MPILSAGARVPYAAKRVALSVLADNNGILSIMHVRRLEAFSAVVRGHHGCDASGRQRAEDRAGARLPAIRSSNGRPKPTAEGMLFYAQADKVLMGMDRLCEAARRIRRAQAGRLVIASHPSAAISVLPGLVSAFLAEHPSLRVRLPSRNSDVIGRLLPGETYPIGIAEPRVAIPPRDASLGLPRDALAPGLIAPSGRGAGAHAADFCPDCAGLRPSWYGMAARRRGRRLRQHAQPRC